MRNVNPAVSIGMSVVLVLGLVPAPAAQTLESEARRALARQGGPTITYDDVQALFWSRDEVVRDIDRNRRLAANQEAFDREVDRVGFAARTRRLYEDNARLEEANRNIERQIAAERERQRLRWVRVVIAIPVNVIVTVVTGSPIIGSAVASGFSTAVTGGDLDEVVIATASSAATAGVNELASLGIEQVATSVGEQAAAKAADELAAYGVQEAVVDKVAAEVGAEVAAKVTRAMDVGLHVVATQAVPGQDPGALSQFVTGLNVVVAAGDLLTPVVIDMDSVMELDHPDAADANIAALVERGRVGAAQLAANSAGALCGTSLTGDKVAPDAVCINALVGLKSGLDAASVSSLAGVSEGIRVALDPACSTSLGRGKVVPDGACVDALIVGVKSAMDDADTALIKDIERTLDVGNGIKGALTASTVGGLLLSRNAGEAITELGALILNDNLEETMSAVRAVDRITSCTIAKNIAEHTVIHDLTGEREKYFRSLHGQWSSRCAR